ncbi:MAG: hypothetical protein H7287_02020 [Thermoleophilia bacterium]|nr:hypothetical protein [Thermoleophilia bacterium]
MPAPANQPTEVADPRRSRTLLVRILLATWLIGVVAAYLAINVGMADPASADSTFTGLWPLNHPYWFNPLIALVAIVPALILGLKVGRAFGLRTRPGSAAAAFAAGIIAWSIGNLVWFWYNTCTSWGALGCAHTIEAPYPSAADVGFIGLLPCYAFAMVQLSRMLATTWGDVLRLAWIPVLAFAGTAFLMVPDFTVLGVHVPAQSLLFDEGYSATQTSFSVLYIVSDAVLLSMAVINLVRARQAAGGIFFRAVLLTAVALLLQYFGDLLFDVRVANGSEYAGDIADFIYFWALFVMVLGIYVLGRAHERLQAHVSSMSAAMSLALTADRGEPVAAAAGGDTP